jgi:expansin (peptidoglycan-binding protein)
MGGCNPGEPDVTPAERQPRLYIAVATVTHHPYRGGTFIRDYTRAVTAADPDEARQKMTAAFTMAEPYLTELRVVGVRLDEIELLP